MQTRLFGVPVTVENGVWMIGGVYLLLGLNRAEPIVMIVAGILALFGSILWHEIGHASAARFFGLGNISIRLHGFGGLTSHAPSGNPWKDLAITLSGPGFGIALGILTLVLWLAWPAGAVSSILGELALINLFWSLFNLLPLFPLDGGQAMASLLRIFAPAVAAPVTAGLGLFGGVGLGLLGVWLLFTGGFGGIFLLLIAGMIVQNNLSLWERIRAA